MRRAGQGAGPLARANEHALELSDQRSQHARGDEAADQQQDQPEDGLRGGSGQGDEIGLGVRREECHRWPPGATWGQEERRISRKLPRCEGARWRYDRAGSGASAAHPS